MNKTKTTNASPRHSGPNSGAETEAAFIAAGTKLFAEKGFKGTSISDLAREINLTTASLYYYVDGKQGLLAKVLEAGMADFLARLQAIAEGDGTPREKLERAVDNHIDFVVDRRDVVRIFLRYRSMLEDGQREHYQGLLDSYQQYFTEILTAARSDSLSDTDIVVLRQAVLGMINSLVEWYDPAGRVPPADLKPMFSSLVLQHLLRSE